MTVKFWNPGKEFELHEKEYTKVWKDVRKRGDLILRKDVEEFEIAFAQYVGTKYAVGVNSGTDALFIALKSLGVGYKDKVLVPSHNFVATAQVVQQLKAEIVLYDINAKKSNLSFSKAVIITHIAGEIDPKLYSILELAREWGMPVIEDACQSLGAEQNCKKAGSFGEVGCFSFYPAKILGAAGDGGALVTNDKKIYEFAREYRNHWKKDYSQWGINSRLDNVLAAELNIKLKRLPKVLERRGQIAHKYNIYLGELVEIPKPTNGRVYQDYIIHCKDNQEREDLFKFLKDNGIETLKNEYLTPEGYKLPEAAKYEAETLRLPCNETITNEEVDYVIEKVKEFYEFPKN